MSFHPGGIGPVTVTGSGSVTIATPTIVNIAVPTANNEQSYLLPAGTRMFRMTVREGARLQVAFAVGESNSNYLTRFPGFTYESPNLPLDASVTVYFQCSKATQTVEIESWA